VCGQRFTGISVQSRETAPGQDPLVEEALLRLPCS